MMTATCLGMIGAEGPVVTEGPFARNRLYLEMLAAALGRPVLGAGRVGDGDEPRGGAADAARRPAPEAEAEAAVGPEARFAGYAAGWREAVRA